MSGLGMSKLCQQSGKLGKARVAPQLGLPWWEYGTTWLTHIAMFRSSCSHTSTGKCSERVASLYQQGSESPQAA